MKKSHKKRHYDNIIYILMFIFMVSTVLEIIAYRSFQNESYQQKRSEVINEVMDIRANLEREINSTVMLIGGLSIYVETNPDISLEEFQEFAANLYQKSGYLRNIALAPGNVISYCYPVEGNEKAIGLDLAKHPTQKYAIELMMERRRPVLAGPLELVQGGEAIVSRIPIYVQEDGKEYYWGLTSIPIDIQAIYEISGVYEKQKKLEIAIRGRDGLGESGIVFFGSSHVFRDDPVLMDISLGSGKWQIAAIPRGGWRASREDVLKPLILLLINILILALVGVIVDQSEKSLKYETELFESEKKYRILANNSKDIIWTIDLEETLTYVSPSIEHEFKIKAVDMTGKKLCEFVNAREYVVFKRNIFEKDSVEKAEGNYFEMEFTQPKHVWLGTRVSELIDDNGKIIGYLCISRDITESKKLKEEFELMATTDYLTGLYNRRKFNEMVERDVKRLSRYGGDLSVLIFDIDFFKRVNDTYGHKTGDLVLKDIGSISSGLIRQSDIAARYGGEEFVVALSNTGIEDARVFAEGLRTAVEENVVEFMGDSIQVTISVGISSYERGKTMDEMIINADKALYHAKRTGRNKVVDEREI